MKPARRLRTTAIALALAAFGPQAVAEEEEDEKAWSFSASAFSYVLPDEPDYVQPTVTADYGSLHLEARYNYEDHQTGSAWVGYNFAGGDAFSFELTPIVGVVFGDTDGVAPGLEASLAWRQLDLSSEIEYVFDTAESSDSFLYTWSELGWSPEDWLRMGLVVQRTKAYKSEFDIERGFFAGVAYRNASVTAYVLNPDASEPTVVVGVSVDF
jgi:hypothetical protein